MFLEALSAYKLEFGSAFPHADPRSVLRILHECTPEPKSQKQIEEATGIAQSNAAKLMGKMIEHRWLDATERDPKTAVKKVLYHRSRLGSAVDI
jgi:hypothetical protein